MRLLAAALMLAASTSAQAQTYDPVEILPTELPTVPTIVTPVATNLGDDATRQVDLNFTFTYFGQDFTKAWISSNGFVSFQSPANLCCNGQQLQNAQRNTIYEYWTDLINWSGTPYYTKQSTSDGTNYLLVGWYGTNEYGTNNKPTSFEMYLYDTGRIDFNYIKTYDMQYHTVTAGLTGPTSTDNISLFYGTNSSTLSGKLYSFNYQTGTVIVDCNISPMDPSCPTLPAGIDIPGVSTSPVDTITSVVNTTPASQETEVVSQEIQAATEVAIQQEQAAEETAAAVEQAAEQTAAAEQVVAEQQVSTPTVTAAVAVTSTTKESSTKSADRLNPSQLAALNSGGGSSEVSQISSSASLDSQQSGEASSRASMQLFTSASNASIAMADMEQQQQLQSSVDSSTLTAQVTGNLEQSTELLASTGQQVVSQSDGKMASVSYQDQQKLSGIDSNNKDSNINLPQIVQPDQILASTEQQATIIATQQEEDKSSLTVVQIESSQASISATESKWQESISSQSATLEALNTINNTNSQNSSENQESGSSLGEGQSEVMAQLAYVPGFSAYKLVSLPDRPDFYKPRRIYKNNRPVDAYMSLFKMTAANDNLWKQMVESQYE